jgi:hypothetical protein
MANAKTQTTRDRGLAFAFGLIFVVTVLAIVLAVPDPTPSQWFVFRVVLALAAAGIGAVIPGLLVVHVSTMVRAGGALALFVLVYSMNPPALISKPQATQTIQQKTQGDGSPAVVSQGDVTIGNPSAAKEKRK